MKASRPAVEPAGTGSTARRGSRTVRRTSQATPSGAGRVSRGVPDRPDVDAGIPGPPSSLNVDRHPSSARSGREELEARLGQHTGPGPALTGGDIDADWGSADSVGDETPGGDNPTPGQQVVDEIGRSLGLQYEDSEELKGADKITRRDQHRWELDPASAEDYRERTKQRR